MKEHHFIENWCSLMYNKGNKHYLQSIEMQTLGLKIRIHGG